VAWAPAYTTEDDLATYLDIEDSQDDVVLGLAIEAASRAVDQECNRQFGQVEAAEERIYTARPWASADTWLVDVDDFQNASGLEVTVDGTTVATFTKEPRNAAQKGRPWTALGFSSASEVQPCSGDEVVVTAVWGWTSVPTAVVQATLLQASRLVSRRNAPFGVAGSPEAGSEMRLLAKVDPDVAVALRAYRRTRSVF
jgi:hypothetical protein